MTWPLESVRRWTDVGTGLFDEQLATLTEADGAAPSSLPGWTRKHLAAHVIGNADALGNLVHWAASGTPTPKYSSPEQRKADIDAGAVLPLQVLLHRFGTSATDLTLRMNLLTPAQWSREVVTAQGRAVPATANPVAACS